MSTLLLASTHFKTFYIYSVSGGPFLLLNQHALEEKISLKLASLSFSHMRWRDIKSWAKRSAYTSILEY